ncbi:hypothetical protein MRX96_033361 [Rhipicephalus microplus]
MLGLCPLRLPAHNGLRDRRDNTRQGHTLLRVRRDAPRDMSWTLRKMQESEHESMGALAEWCQCRLDGGTWFHAGRHLLDAAIRLRPDGDTENPSSTTRCSRRTWCFSKGTPTTTSWWETSSGTRQFLSSRHSGALSQHSCAPFAPSSRTLWMGVDKSVVREVAELSPELDDYGEYAVIQCAGMT